MNISPIYFSIVAIQTSRDYFCDIIHEHTHCGPLLFMTPYSEENYIPLHRPIYNLPSGTTRDNLTVIGRDQTDRLGQTGGTSKNPM